MKMPKYSGIKTVRFEGMPGLSRDSDDNGNRSRWPADSNRRNFKASGKHGGKYRIKETALRAHFAEDDDMNDTSSGGPNRHDKRSRFSKKYEQGRLSRGSYDWFQVTIPYGQNYERQFLLQSIKDHLGPNDIFIPYLWKQDKDNVSFFVDNFDIADQLLGLDRKIPLKGNLKMIIKVRNGIPSVQVDETLKTRMGAVMSKRYNDQTKSLDMTKFHSDPDMIDLFCPLFRAPIMLAAFDIMNKYIPQLVALNLSNNKIHHLDHFKCIKDKLPYLRILCLENNRIQTLGALESLRGLPIEELILNGNPIKERYSKTYASEIRKRLPKLQKLDGLEMGAVTAFDVSDQDLPVPKASFLVSSNSADFIRMFIEQYYAIFDSDNRQPLLDAYHENAMFSLTVASVSQQNKRITSFWPYNRNAFRRRDTDMVDKNLIYGKMSIVAFLLGLPKTRHDPQSLAVDFSLQTATMAFFCLSGVFREMSNNDNGNERESKLHSFQRSFIVEPFGSGYSIKHEMLHIASPSPTQLKVVSDERNVVSNSAALRSQPSASQPLQPIVQQIVQPIVQPSTSFQLAPAPVNPETGKLQMVQALCQQTNMNASFSQKCLEDTEWNFQRALDAFKQLNEKGLVPPEAFNK